MRIGLWGGSFDPIHIGHLIAASTASDALKLDAFFFIPAFVSPFKQGSTTTPVAIRVSMVKEAIKDDVRFKVDDIEAMNPVPSYTVDTVRYFKETMGEDTELFLMVGGDWVESFPTWKDVGKILDMAQVVVLPRGGISWSEEAGFPAISVDVPRIDISSTEIRRRVEAGESIRYLVPEGVERIISAETLYREKKIKSVVSL